jgi:DNA-binding XRE family transcriptional regulator
VEHFQVAPQSYNLIAGFRHCAEIAGLTDSGTLGRFLGCSRITVYYWLTGKVRPPLAIVLHFCRLLGLDVLALLRRHTLSIQMLMKPVILDGRVVISARRREPSDLEVRAWRILSDATASPPSLNGLAAQLGTNPKYLRKHFPALARQTIENHTAYRTNTLTEFEKNVTAEIREICGRLVAEGRRPTRRSISRRLSQPGALRWPCLQSATDRIIQGLGFK